MDLRGWDNRYRLKQRPGEDFEAAPTPLVVQTAERLPVGKALDLACGAGRNALWLAAHGWEVTAVDGAAAAIEELRSRVREHHLVLDARVANLERGEFHIRPKSWDLILMCYHLQVDLFSPAKQGVVPGGTILVIVHAAAPGEQPNPHSLRAGDLPNYFRGWEILHTYEGPPTDPSHRRRVAEIVARRPLRDISA